MNKSLKDLDCSLVANENLSKILPSSDLCPGPSNLTLKGQKTTPLMTSLTKNMKTKNKIFFPVQILTRLAESFEGLNSYLAPSTGGL